MPRTTTRLNPNMWSPMRSARISLTRAWPGSTSVGRPTRNRKGPMLPDPAALNEIADAVDVVEPPSAEPNLLLQKMENRLLPPSLAAPDVLSVEQLRQLRYILNFARLADFEPGAAGPGGRRGRGDVSIGAEISPWRA